MEQEINGIVIWASLQKKTVVLAGDLNMDRLRPNEREGKILIDMEEVNNLKKRGLRLSILLVIH